MYPKYNIPQYNYNMQRNIPYNYKTMPTNNPGDRFFPGGFIAPFLLGGIAGSLITRPNYAPYPPVVYYPPYPQPYYSNSNYYY